MPAIAALVTAGVAALWVLRLAGASSDTLWLWSQGAWRHLPRALALALALVALALAASPRILLERAAGVVEWPRAAWAALATAVALYLLPDRVGFLGDFLLREGTTVGGGAYARI